MNFRASVITISDKAAKGLRVDTSGPALAEMLRQDGWDVVYTAIVEDEIPAIQAELRHCSDIEHIELILTTGGTGFSKRDVTPEATLAMLEKRTPGIVEAMRAKSMEITPKGCLSRGESGMRGDSLVINLPGSRKAATENLAVILPALRHGVEMMLSMGSADCGHDAPQKKGDAPPEMDRWLKEAKQDPSAEKCGMYLVHNGVVRRNARAKVREGKQETADVTGMDFDFDQEKVDAAVESTYRMEGIYYLRTWLNRGRLEVGEDIMVVMVGGDTRPHVIAALEHLVGEIKTKCVIERERF